MTTSPLLDRRRTLRTLAGTFAAPAVAAFGGSLGGNSFAQGVPSKVRQAIADFAKMEPRTCSALVRVDAPTGTWSAGHNADARLFVGSAVKTFILAEFLRQAEAGTVAQNEPCEIDDRFRSLSSPVFGRLSGMSTYGHALDAMIAYSDNMATDIALSKATPERVRALIAQAGLKQTQIPTSTRRLFSYLAGGPLGVDLGWDAMRRLADNQDIGLKPRTDVINANESMVSSASDLVSWYQQVLAGKFFKNPSSTREFKRISSMATALWLTVPKDVIAFGKGGSIDWEDFHALCLAGQMRVRDVPVSFCFSLNWTGGPLDSNSRVPEYGAAVSRVLAQVHSVVRG